MTVRRALALAGAALALAGAASVQPPSPAGPNPSAIFTARCANCHLGGDPRIPPVDALRQHTAESIVEALTSGVMREQGASMSAAERRAVAEFLAAPAAAADASSSGCRATAPFDRQRGGAWSGWGPDSANTRFQPSARAGLTPEAIPKLTLKWAFGFPNATSARAQPTIAGGRLFVGSQSGIVYSLDAKTGCTAWTFRALASVRTAIVIAAGSNARPVAYFGDGRSNVYALDAETGAPLWTRRVETHPSSHVTGAPTLFETTLYVPIASGEEGQGDNKDYACCTFRGSLVALDAATGDVRWKTYMIADEPKQIGTNRGGAPRWGPSGAGIWSSPTIDPVRRQVYVATGNMYTEPQTKASDAVAALDMQSGKVLWMSQVTPRDVFVVGCNSPTAANCSDDVGPDFDFGNSPMLVPKRGGGSLLVIGQKSGIGFALDPDKQGAVVWQYRAGAGSALGGMEFGSAADGDFAFFGVADGNRPSAGELHAVWIQSGEKAWVALPRPVLCGERGRGCTPAILAAISVIPGAVFAGAMDGGFRAYSTKDGALLWEFDTNRSFDTVNHVPARGASMSGPGPAIADGMVYVNSGYGALGGRPGNVLLAFGVE